MKKLLTFTRFAAALAAALVLPLGCSSGAGHAQDAQQSTVTLRIGGMTCASCSLTVRITLEGLDGVQSAVVSVEHSRARVTYDRAQVTPQQMVDAVNGAGYRARVAPEQGAAG